MRCCHFSGIAAIHSCFAISAPALIKFGLLYAFAFKYSYYVLCFHVLVLFVLLMHGFLLLNASTSENIAISCWFSFLIFCYLNILLLQSPACFQPHFYNSLYFHCTALLFRTLSGSILYHAFPTILSSSYFFYKKCHILNTSLSISCFYFKCLSHFTPL